MLLHYFQCHSHIVRPVKGVDCLPDRLGILNLNLDLPDASKIIPCNYFGVVICVCLEYLS